MICITNSVHNVLVTSIASNNGEKILTYGWKYRCIQQ